MSFSIDQVRVVSNFLQQNMQTNNKISLTADECAELLAINNVLCNNVGPKPGFNFREMLRQGRDQIIPLVDGVFQEEQDKEWSIFRSEKFPNHLHKHMKTLGVVYICDIDTKNIKEEKEVIKGTESSEDIDEETDLNKVDVGKIKALKKLSFASIGHLDDLLKEGLPDNSDLKKCGVYAITKPKKYKPYYFNEETAKENGNVINPWSIEKLKKKWVLDCDIIYFGLAGRNKPRSLKDRLEDLIDHGHGKITDSGPHKGGEILWQLKDQINFEVWILPTGKPPEPRNLELQLNTRFKKLKGKLPFANRQL